MNREEAKEIAKVIQAYADGKEVQCLEMTGWGDVLHPTFDPFFSWRIKPESKRTVGYRDYYWCSISNNVYKGTLMENDGIPYCEIEQSDTFIKWKHTEWQYDDVEVE